MNVLGTDCCLKIWSAESGECPVSNLRIFGVLHIISVQNVSKPNVGDTKRTWGCDFGLFNCRSWQKCHFRVKVSHNFYKVWIFNH